MFRDDPLVPCRGPRQEGENKVTQSIAQTSDGCPAGRAALIAAGLSVSTAATVAIAVPIATSSAQDSSAPTASIQVWMEANGTPVDNYWAAQAKAFDKANPGDSVSIDIEPSGPYNTKVATGLAGNNPPALIFGWGGGRDLQRSSMQRWCNLSATPGRATPATPPGRATSWLPASGP